jgi:teichuronic acid biosynthesis glycosyltransferase TuaC
MDTLLIIASRYTHAKDPVSGVFVYSQVEELKKHFKKIVVISTTPYVPKILAKYMSIQRQRDSHAKNYAYDNVEVIFTRNKILPVPFLTKYRNIQGYRSAKKILKKMKYYPNLIHAHFSWPSGDIALKLKKHFQVPVIITVHEDHNWLMKEEKNINIRSIWQNADALIRVNKLDIPVLLKYNNKTYNITNGFLQKKYKIIDKNQCREHFGLSKDQYIFFSLGNLIEIKGFQDLIDAAKEVIKLRKDVKFIIGGEGQLRSELERKIRENNLTDYVRLIGFVPDNEVPIWINAADFFILPSYSEGNPTVMFEALGCGKPFIGTNVGGIPEIINDSKLGILCSPGDIKGLSLAIFDSLDKKWDNGFILKTAMQYSWDNIANQIRQVYIECIKLSNTSQIEKRRNEK